MKKRNPKAIPDELDHNMSSAILNSRAISLAQAPASEGQAEFVEVALFRLAYEIYGIETVFIREVYPLKELTPLPGVPAFVAGIINVRGQVLSVIDLKKFFELPEQGLSDLNKVIILSNGTMEFGILADAIVEARNIPCAELESSLPTLMGIREQYLKGLTTERYIILDAIKLLTDNKIVVHEEVII